MWLPVTWWWRFIARQNADKAPVPSFMLKDSPCFIGLKKNQPALKAKVDALIEQG